MQVITKIRNNWKKSVFFSGLFTYGTYYLIERKRNGELMQAYCFEALKYSKEMVNPEKVIKRVMIFLNPVANRERGRFLYDKNVAPLLHLSGLDVRLIRLDKNSEANEYMKEIDFAETDCIVVAGGNATLNEVISGLLHREKSGQKIPPIGVIPIGETNTFAHKWLNMLGVKHNTESEIRLLANSAMAIIRGETVEADLLKVSLKHSPNYHVDQIMNASQDANTRGAYSLVKEDKIYALSNVSCGFLTETEASVDNFRYFWRLKSYMNRYFMDRYLRRDPVKYDFSYKLKCFGCSKCLNGAHLKQELDDLIANKQSHQSNSGSSSLLKLFYNKLINVVQVPSSSKDNAAQLRREKRKEELKNLIEKSKIENKECGKTNKSTLLQVQIISSINDLDFENPQNDPSASCIDTVIVKDPEFNAKDMFLAEKKQLKEYEIKRLHSDKPQMHKTINSDLFSIEIDGEIYKLINSKEINLTIKVKHLEKHIRMIKCDPNATKIHINNWPKIYLISKKTFEEEFSTDVNKLRENSLQTPNILPFEKFYLKYWKPQETVKF